MALNALQLAEMYAREQRRQAYFRQQLETQRQLGRDQVDLPLPKAQNHHRTMSFQGGGRGGLKGC